MIPVLLTKIKTRDGLTLDGVYVPARGAKKYALIWIHGLTSHFSSGQTLIKELSSLATASGIGYFKFNNRGHDVVAYGRGKDTDFFGTAFERFEDCIHDIRAMIAHARSLGYKKIILAGHSTGANKTLYYMYKTRDRKVKALLLAGALSDPAIEIKRISRENLERALAKAHALYRKNRLALMPQEHGMFVSAARYISLATPNGREDVFPYHNPQARWKELTSVRIPLAVILGSRDKYLDRPAKNLVEIFKNHATHAVSFSGIIINGAGHSFVKKEKELSQKIIHWIKKN